MDFYEVLKRRRSIRGFESGKEIPADALERIMYAVQCAPSACNRQPWRFEIVFNSDVTDYRSCDYLRKQRGI